MKRLLVLRHADQVLTAHPLGSGQKVVRVDLAPFRELAPGLPDAVEFDPTRSLLTAIGGSIPIPGGRGMVPSRSLSTAFPVPLDRHSVLIIELKREEQAAPVTDDPLPTQPPPGAEPQEPAAVTHQKIAELFIETIEIALRLSAGQSAHSAADSPDLALLRRAVADPASASMHHLRSALRQTRDQILGAGQSACYAAFNLVLDHLAASAPDQFGTPDKRRYLTRIFQYHVDSFDPNTNHLHEDGHMQM